MSWLEDLKAKIESRSLLESTGQRNGSELVIVYIIDEDFIEDWITSEI